MKNYLKKSLLVGLGLIGMQAYAATYLADQSISIDEQIDDDVYAAGGVVTVNAPIRDDAFLTGETVEVRDAVGDDVYLAGKHVVISGDISGDVYVFGQFITSQGARIGGEMYVFGQDVKLLNSEISGDIFVYSATLELNSRVGGNVQARNEKLTLGGGAQIAGSLTMSDTGADVNSELVGGEIIIDQKKKQDDHNTGKQGKGGWMVTLFIGKLLTLLVTTLVIHYLMRKERHVPAFFRENILMSFLMGIALLILMPIFGLILCFIPFFLPLGIATLLIYILGFFVLGEGFALAFLYRKHIEKYGKNWATWKKAGFFFVGALILTLLVGVDILIVAAVLGAYMLFSIQSHK